MSRWQPDARERLAYAALELFVEQGFAETTVPQIAERAGLTTRTFFRYFADKREVLFAEEDEIPAMVASLVVDAPADLDPMMVIEYGIAAKVSRFEGQREYLRTRRAFVQADDGLRERELRKFDMLGDAIKGGFLDRGLDELSATLVAQTAVTAFSVAVGRWLDHDGEESLAELVRDTLHALRLITAGPDTQRRDT